MATAASHQLHGVGTSSGSAPSSPNRAARRALSAKQELKLINHLDSELDELEASYQKRRVPMARLETPDKYLTEVRTRKWCEHWRS